MTRNPGLSKATALDASRADAVTGMCAVAQALLHHLQ